MVKCIISYFTTKVNGILAPSSGSSATLDLLYLLILVDFLDPLAQLLALVGDKSVQL